MTSFVSPPIRCQSDYIIPTWPVPPSWLAVRPFPILKIATPPVTPTSWRHRVRTRSLTLKPSGSSSCHIFCHSHSKNSYNPPEQSHFWLAVTIPVTVSTLAGWIVIGIDSILPHIHYICLCNANKAAHSGFETQRRRHQKSKTGVPVAPKMDMCPPKTLKKKLKLFTFE